MLTGGEGLACPSCRAPLELSRASRVLSAAAGLVLAFAVGLGAFRKIGGPQWIFGVVGAVLGYGTGSALTLSLVSDLVALQKTPGGDFPHASK